MKNKLKNTGWIYTYGKNVQRNHKFNGLLLNTVGTLFINLFNFH